MKSFKLTITLVISTFKNIIIDIIGFAIICIIKSFTNTFIRFKILKTMFLPVEINKTRFTPTQNLSKTACFASSHQFIIPSICSSSHECLVDLSCRLPLKRNSGNQRKTIILRQKIVSGVVFFIANFAFACWRIQRQDFIAITLQINTFMVHCVYSSPTKRFKKTYEKQEKLQKQRNAFLS